MTREPAYIDRYKALGLVDASGKCFPLHKGCSQTSECWKEAQPRIPEADNDWNLIYAPYFGEQYERTRLLIVAENMYEFGDWRAVDKLVSGAKEEIAAENTRVRFGNDWKKYPGSFLWHRVGSYSAAFAERLGQMSGMNWLTNGFPDFPDVCRGFDYLAFTNHVKCSPAGGRSKPTPRMWANCGRHILRQEIELASPSCLLVLGTGCNRRAFDRHVFSKKNCRAKIGLAIVGGRWIEDTRIAFVALPHPSSFRYSPSTVMTDFRKAVEFLLINQLIT
jgi:hypothetical protein